MAQWTRFVSSFQRMPEWLQCMLVGAAIISAAGPIFGAVLYTIQGVLSSDSIKLIEAALLVFVSFVGGGVLGLSFYFTQFLRQKGFLGRWVGWSVIFNIYLLTISLLMLSAHAMDGRIEIPRDADEPRFILFMLAFGVLFGVVAAVIEHILVQKTKRA